MIGVIGGENKGNKQQRMESHPIMTAYPFFIGRTTLARGIIRFFHGRSFQLVCDDGARLILGCFPLFFLYFGKLEWFFLRKYKGFGHSSVTPPFSLPVRYSSPRRCARPMHPSLFGDCSRVLNLLASEPRHSGAVRAPPPVHTINAILMAPLPWGGPRTID